MVFPGFLTFFSISSISGDVIHLCLFIKLQTKAAFSQRFKPGQDATLLIIIRILET